MLNSHEGGRGDKNSQWKKERKRHLILERGKPGSEVVVKTYDLQLISERECAFRVKTKFYNTLTSIYAPTEEKSETIKEQFYTELENAYDKIPKYDIKIIMGDFNAKVGKARYLELACGEHSLHEETNKNGKMMINFANGTDLTVEETWFKHKDIHKRTWNSPDKQTFNQIYHVLVDRRHSASINDVRSLRGVETGSDHYLDEDGCNENENRREGYDNDNILSTAELYVDPPDKIDIDMAINKLRNNKAPGADNIPAELIKKGDGSEGESPRKNQRKGVRNIENYAHAKRKRSRLAGEEYVTEKARKCPNSFVATIVTSEDVMDLKTWWQMYFKKTTKALPHPGSPHCEPGLTLSKYKHLIYDEHFGYIEACEYIDSIKQHSFKLAKSNASPDLPSKKVYDTAGVPVNKKKIADVGKIVQCIPDEHQYFYQNILSWLTTVVVDLDEQA
ncbi:hypothetical protein ANN_00737 [Periplaneta americana]|uniref:Craniofacial development protein 2-like n=1 Tax=Periplaneta americana TaxID=6978 RepID=A0ABQ8TRS8_PERAM|nr:hypothetical protein ANN_00737 [Periplaneta americana]